MSATLEVDVRLPLGGFELAVAWTARSGSLALFGHSGAGKTSLLEAIAGLRGGVRGRIAVAGRTWLDDERGVDLPARRRGVGYVPQDLLLFPHRDVLGNVLAGRRRAAGRAGPRLDPRRVLDVLEISGLARRRVADLSGGERRRVALARALCSGPEILLLDEPLAGLDLALRGKILPYLLRMREAFAVPTLYVSHEPGEVQMLADEVGVLASGRLIAAGPVGTVLADPAVLPIVRAEGRENVLRGSVTSVDRDVAALEIGPGLAVSVPSRGLAIGSVASVLLRAEDIVLSLEPPGGLSARNALPGIVRDIREIERADDLEGQVLVVLDLAGGRASLVAAITERSRLALGIDAGSRVHAVFKTHACRVLAAG